MVTFFAGFIVLMFILGVISIVTASVSNAVKQVKKAIGKE